MSLKFMPTCVAVMMLIISCDLPCRKPFSGASVVCDSSLGTSEKFSRTIPKNPLLSEKHGDVTLYMDERYLTNSNPVFNLKYRDIYVFDICGIYPMFFENNEYIITFSNVRENGMNIGNGIDKFRINVIKKASKKMVTSKIIKSKYIFHPDDYFDFKDGILHIRSRKPQRGSVFFNTSFRVDDR